MSFHVGQKVVCVNTTPSKHPLSAGLHGLIRKGAVYTIRDIDHRCELLHGAPTIRLEEIAVPTQSTILGAWEPGFGASRFRPVSTTDISALTELLNPLNHKVIAPTPGDRVRPRPVPVSS